METIKNEYIAKKIIKLQIYEKFEKIFSWIILMEQLNRGTVN